MIGPRSYAVQATTPSRAGKATTAVAGHRFMSAGRKPLSVTAYRVDSEKSKISKTESAAAEYNFLQQKLGRPAEASMAWVATAPNQPLEKMNLIQDQPLKANEVDIAVTTNGVCHSDLHMQHNEWAMSKYPFVPGHEVVGTLLAHGSEVQGMVLGERLGVAWIRDSCRRCYACLKGQENVCAKGYEGTILNGNFGGFQSVIRVPADFAYKIPDGLSSEAAAPLLCAGITVYAPLKRFMAPGQRVGVLGIGGLGHLAIQFASKMGGYTAALDLGRSKEKEVMDLGAHILVDMTNKEDWQRYTGENGFDVIINCASANVNTGVLLSMLRNDGTLIQVGIPGGGQMTLPVQDMVFGQKKVAGSIVGGRADMYDMLQLAATHDIAPLVETMPFSKVNEALEKLAKGQAHYRIVLTLGNEEA